MILSLTRCCAAQILLPTLLGCFVLPLLAADVQLNRIWAPDFKQRTVDDGLSQSFAEIILQDSDEFIWVVTQVGVDRFNGYEFVSIPFSKSNLRNPQSQICALLLDKNNRVLAVTQEGYVFEFQPEIQQFSAIYEPKEKTSSSTAEIIANNQLLLSGESGFVLLDLSTSPLQKRSTKTLSLNGIIGANQLHNEANKVLWVTTINGELYSIDQKNGQMATHQFARKLRGNSQDTLIITKASGGGVFAAYQSGEIFKVKHEREKAIPIPPLSDDRGGLENITAIQQTSEQNLWVATRGEGLYRLNLSDASYRQFKAQKNMNGSLSSNNLYRLFFDKQQQLWVSAPDGINYAQVEGNRFFQIGGKKAYVLPLTSLSVYNIVVDKTGKIWVGTHDAGVNVLVPDQQAVNGAMDDNLLKLAASYQLKSFNSPKFVTALAIDNNQILWAGSNTDLQWIDTVTTNKLEVSKEWRDIGRKGVVSIRISQQEKLLTTVDNSIYFQTADSEILSFSSPIKESNLDLTKIVGPVNDNYWIASSGSGYILQFNRTTLSLTAHQIFNKENAPLRKINSLWLSADNQLWIGTVDEGLIHVDLNSNTPSWVDTSNGLADNRVFDILGDRNGFIWATGNRGLTQFAQTENGYQQFTVKDGIQSNEFNSSSAFRSDNGLLFLGGINGITVIDENEFSINQHIPKTYIQNVMLLTSEGSKKLNISSDKSLAPLDYHSNSLTFKIGAIDLLNPEGNTYFYRLQGNKSEWTELGNNRNINFLNLAAGNYQLEVKSCNSNKICNPKPEIVKFSIAPPPWLSIWAYFIYAFIVLFAIYYLFKRQQAKFRFQQQMTEKERLVVEELRELHTLKDEFLANTSHELRTPLNGIIGLSQLLAQEPENKKNPEAAESLMAINQCGLQLKSLVDELLDYSHVKNRRLILKRELFDINPVIEQIVLLSQPQCTEHNLNLTMALTKSPLIVYADENRIRQVLYNLTNNAIKFSDHGTITISAEKISNYVKISVSDQGLGIPKSLQHKIFFSFTQLNGSSTRNQGGVGLGLAISKEIIDLHGSHLELNSEVGKGSKFSFSLPVQSSK